MCAACGRSLVSKLQISQNLTTDDFVVGNADTAVPRSSLTTARVMQVGRLFCDEATLVGD
jgi:hypothetical protein